jgi:hypothetical protein
MEREAREKVSRVEAKSTTTLASARKEIESLVRKITLLEGEHAEVRWAHEVAEETTCGQSNAAADAKRRWEESERGCQEQLEELTLLQARGSKLYHTKRGCWEQLEELTLLHLSITYQRGCGSLLSATLRWPEFTLVRSPNETFRVEVVDELVAKFQKLDERCSWYEQPSMRIYDLLIGPPSSWSRLAGRLDKATEQLGVELATWREVNAELEALRALATWVQDLVQDRADGSSSLAASMSMATALLEGHVDAIIANVVHWQTQSMLVTTLSHLPELEAELELLRSSYNTALMEDQVDALWILARPTSN